MRVRVFESHKCGFLNKKEKEQAKENFLLDEIDVIGYRGKNFVVQKKEEIVCESEFVSNITLRFHLIQMQNDLKN